MKEETTKRKTFKRLATARLENALDALDLLSLIADKTRYDFGDADVNIIAAELEQKTREVVEKFVRGNPRPVVRFQ